MKSRCSGGFALPSVLIASIIMLTVLLAAITSTAAVRTSLLSQYYNQLSRTAGDAGIAYAKACLAANNGVPQWTDVAPLEPNTDCTGTQLAGFTCPTNSIDARCSVAFSGVSKVGVFLVGGGGGGGGGESNPAGDAAGGGGAGGVIYNALFPIALQTYTVTVGGGGAGATESSLNGVAGNDSVFSTLSAVGGGYGAREDGVGGAGGSGGGGGGSCSTGDHLGGLGTAGQGYSGGTGIQSVCNYRGGAGGGGYAATGSDDLSTGAGGGGGGGISNNISGATVLYAGGGGGGAASNVGALGGAGQARGGNGGSSPDGAGTNATANSGSGGGGAGSGINVGGAGGSGIVIVSYPTGTITATGGTITTNGGNTIHTFIGSGTFTVTVISNSSGGVITSFSVPRPQLDSNGKAINVTATSTTKLLRTSDNSVWRQYTQSSKLAIIASSISSTPITAIADITGTTTVDSTLTAGALTPSGATVTYQWQSATTVGGTYTDISGATNNTYTLVAGDVDNYLKVVATAIGSYSGTQTSAASTVVSDPNWIVGIAATALAGKRVYKTDLGSTMQYKTTNDAVASPQGATGLDPNYPDNMSLFSPQTNPDVDFSAYPAQNACKAIGGRLPNTQELIAMYADRATYGDNFQASVYWSSTEYSSTYAYRVFFLDGGTDYNNKTSYPYVRCVKDFVWLTIGTQVWASTNLNVGTRIAGASDQTNNVGTNVVEKYCYDDTDAGCTNADSNGVVYGGLYQWDEAMQYVTTEGAQGICPTGSHIPTDAEWTTLDTYLTIYATPPQSGGSSGLNMPLAGGRFADGSFLDLSLYAYLWSSSESGTSAWERYLSSAWDPTLYQDAGDKAYGLSVRCIGN